MKTIKTLLVFVTLVIGTITFAQTHNTTTGSNCKYAKNRCTNMEGCGQCAACDADDKKEKNAKIAEVKKRNDKIWADAKIKKDAEQKAYQDKLAADNAEAKRKAESGNMLINGQQNNSNKTDLLPIKTNQVVAKKGVMVGNIYAHPLFFDNHTTHQESNFFLNQENDTILKSSDYLITYGNTEASINFPSDVGIVTFKTKNNKGYPISDIVDIKGKRYFNNDEIRAIMHLADDYFIICKGLFYASDRNPDGFGLVEIFNFKTKEIIPLKKGNEVYIKTYFGEGNLKKTDRKEKDSFKVALKFEIGWHNYVAVYINLDGKLEIKEFYYPEQYWD